MFFLGFFRLYATCMKQWGGRGTEQIQGLRPGGGSRPLRRTHQERGQAGGGAGVAAGPLPRTQQRVPQRWRQAGRHRGDLWACGGASAGLERTGLPRDGWNGCESRCARSDRDPAFRPIPGSASRTGPRNVEDPLAASQLSWIDKRKQGQGPRRALRTWQRGLNPIQRGLLQPGWSAAGPQAALGWPCTGAGAGA